MDHPRPPDYAQCELCQRHVPRHLITQHHLVPKEKGGKAEHRSPLCKPCHKQIYATFGNADLAKTYPTLEALRQAAELEPFLKWIRRQKPGRNFRTITSHAHPHAKRERRYRR